MAHALYVGMMVVAFLIAWLLDIPILYYIIPLLLISYVFYLYKVIFAKDEGKEVFKGVFDIMDTQLNRLDSRDDYLREVTNERILEAVELIRDRVHKNHKLIKDLIRVHDSGSKDNGIHRRVQELLSECDTYIEKYNSLLEEIVESRNMSSREREVFVDDIISTLKEMRENE